MRRTDRQRLLDALGRLAYHALSVAELLPEGTETRGKVLDAADLALSESRELVKRARKD